MPIDTVNICGIPHTIVTCKDEFGIFETHFGEIDYKKAEIKLADDLSPKVAEETLFHEILHGIFFHIGYEEISQNEGVINALANAMMHTFEIKKEAQEQEGGDVEECETLTE